MPETSKLEEIFWQATRLTDPNERLNYLQAACDGDPQLMERVSSLLRATQEAGAFLETPAHSRPNSKDSERSNVSGLPANHEFPFLTAPTGPDDIGTLGVYRIQKCIGRGGMGIVFQAFDPKLHRVVAVKVLAPEIATDPNARKRFEREARSAAAINHPNVVVIHAVDELHIPPYLVMEFVQGKTLAEKLSTHGTLPIKEILRIGVQVGDGLSAAHKQGLVHRDIKPANILLENGIERVKVTDFGLAKIVNDAALTRDGQLSGTPNFMSPEQASGGIVDHRSDLFSFGAVLYAMCTGNPPFIADNALATLHRILNDHPKAIQQSNVDVPVWLSSIVDRLLAKSPADRFQSASEVARLLRKHLARLQAGPIVSRKKDSADKPSLSDSLRSRISARFVTKMVFVLAATILLALSVFGWSRWPTSSAPSGVIDELRGNAPESPVDVEEIVERYANACQLARDNMLSRFDAQIETTETNSELEPTEKNRRIALLTAEKKNCTNNGSMPFSPLMRSDAIAYLDELKTAQKSAWEAMQKLSQEDFASGKKRITAVKVGVWDFVNDKGKSGGDPHTLMSDGTIVEKSWVTWTLDKSVMKVLVKNEEAPGGYSIYTHFIEDSGLRSSVKHDRYGPSQNIKVD